ncbi:NPCBM/NEW2 domain-containing protein [Paenibacillus sacheonensis]|uniref:PKD domain-containing protein n=1 Tax=Paenibacillus sacheonensis TaxID=742054 RepID=A0A7X4YRC8_9BACL|nr:NPCBM/NEW2 domain-containing protein [Paenibacillus sacheonensis]MBM7563624.1 chitodextrinase [Paenibacillus sacheonensis]NBC71080.1 PKD domain-containing protein [Paenibacillus sacheonensis]
MKLQLSKRAGISLFASMAMTLTAVPVTGYAAGPSLPKASISVASYGANGADTLDDRAGIQAAIDAAQAGDTVLLPKGTYVLSGTVNGKSGVTIKGENRDGTIVKYAGSTDTFMFKFLNASNAAIKNMTLDGNNSSILMSGAVSEGGSGNVMSGLKVKDFVASEGFGPHALLGDHTDHLTVSDNVITNIGVQSIWGAGVRVGWNSTNAVIERNVIADTGRGGIFLNDGSSGAIVRNNRITGSGKKENGLSIELHTNTDNSIIEDNDVDHWISAVRSKTIAVRRNTVHATDGSVGAIGLEIMADNTVTTDNVVDGGQQVGIQQSPGPGHQLWGYNVVKNLVMWGMQLQGAGASETEQFQYFYKNSFMNTQLGNPKAAYPGYEGNGIRIHGNSQNLTFDSNLISGNGRKAIELTGAPGVDKLIFTNNLFYGNKDVTMDPYPTDAKDLEWSGNLVYKNGDNAQPASRGFANAKPKADFTIPLLVREGEPVTFNSTSTDNGSIATYLWDFGTGLPSASPKPTFVYDQAGIYRVTLVVWDNEGRAGLKESIILVRPGAKDTKKPSTPTNVASPSQTDETIALTWSPASDNVGVVGYDVYKDGVLAGSTAPGETTITLTGLTALTSYSITLKARDAAGNVSDPSAALTVTTEAPDAAAPSAPGQLTAASVTGTSASLTWSASTDNKAVTGYIVYRNGIQAGTTSGADATSYTAAGLIPGTSSLFTVKAIDAAGNRSEASNEVEAVLAPPTSPVVYLSDYAYDSGTAGWGSINKDRSSDGKPITLNGVEYPKGLGTHAASTIVYTLGGRYASFHAAVGVDDETFGNGDVSFEVWLDGVKAFDSGVMTATTDTQLIDLDISGVNELKLVITNGIAGGDWDHADWGDLQIVYPSAP